MLRPVETVKYLKWFLAGGISDSRMSRSSLYQQETQERSRRIARFGAVVSAAARYYELSVASKNNTYRQISKKYNDERDGSRTIDTAQSQRRAHQVDGKVGLGCFGFIGSSQAMNLMTEKHEGLKIVMTMNAKVRNKTRMSGVSR